MAVKKLTVKIITRDKEADMQKELSDFLFSINNKWVSLNYSMLYDASVWLIKYSVMIIHEK